jgi:hypothetical protein
MEYTIKLNEQQVELPKSIFEQLGPKQLIVAPPSKPKKLSKVEQAVQNMKERRANKAARKRK